MSNANTQSDESNTVELIVRATRLTRAWGAGMPGTRAISIAFDNSVFTVSFKPWPSADLIRTQNVCLHEALTAYCAHLEYDMSADADAVAE